MYSLNAADNERRPWWRYLWPPVHKDSQTAGKIKYLSIKEYAGGADKAIRFVCVGEKLHTERNPPNIKPSPETSKTRIVVWIIKISATENHLQHQNCLTFGE